MTRLILMIGFTGASRFTKTGLADVALTLDRQLVWGPLPSAAKLSAFFAPRTDQKPYLHWQDYSPAWRIEEAGAKGLGLVEYCTQCESVSLWIDTVPNAQLSLIWLLDYLRSYEELASRLTLVQTDLPVDSQSAGELSKSHRLGTNLRDEHLAVARTAWRAYRDPTPQAWRNLLDQDLTAMPLLRQAVIEMLEELPSPTIGLGATEMRILELVAEGGKVPSDVFPGHESRNEKRVFDYWEFGEVLDGLVRCPAPAVSGLDEGPFSIEMMRQRKRAERYEQSKLSLTTLGKAILAGTEDFSRHNPIDRWWGGTHLTNDNLWRWDAVSKTLVAP
jgi:hypothetical protein